MKKMLEVGDKVRVRSSLKPGQRYDDVMFVDGMSMYKNEVFTISKVITSSKYELNGTEGYTWSRSMLRALSENKEMESEDMNNVVDAIKELTEKINNRTMYDDAISEVIINKAKEVNVKELSEELKTELKNFIKNNYGILPKKIEYVADTKRKEMTGLFHEKFEEILKIVKRGVPLMLTGPAGAGKNHTLEQVAEALGLDFYFSNAVTQEFKLSGFIDASGKYQETQFYKAYTNGGLFFLDEIDASCPEALINLNAAIANKYYDFPCGKVNAHKDFRIVCAGNTFGTGADMIYTGRNVLDGATLDRFAVIEFGYDENVERQLAYNDELYEFIVTLRNVIKENSLRYIVSMRATINSTKLLEVGLTKANILRSAIIKNMSVDDLNTIVHNLKEKLKDNEWVKEFEAITNDRN